MRYRLSEDMEDSEKSIVHCTEAIFLLPISRGGHLLNNIFHLLFYIAIGLLVRSSKLEQPEGVNFSIEYLRYLCGLPLDSFDVPRKDVTSFLV